MNIRSIWLFPSFFEVLDDLENVQLPAIGKNSQILWGNPSNLQENLKEVSKFG